ncbi:MarR family winged helix-turn-helix transcriptional regulator [Pseudoflavonifractor sp. P01025]|uniref:MarR family winged helix-turn-helix transcriptional regulator n=1 Tax=Flintibacter porci TaxID=3342383 RepID=UPI0035B5976C
MEIKTIKALLDACYQAKRIRDLLPALPQGVTPSYIHYLDTIESLEQQGTRVKVSDISDALNLPRPGVTRTVKEMQAKGYLCKQTSPEDGRITYISVTQAGKQLSKRYNEQYFSRLAPLLSDISQEDAACTIQTIERFYEVMSKGGITVESSER